MLSGLLYAEDRSTPISSPPEKTVRSLPIATVLAVTFGTLVVITVVIVLGITLVSGITNTRDLLIDKAGTAMEAAENDLRDLLNPAAFQSRYMAELIRDSKLDTENSEQLADFLLGAVAGTPQITSLTYVTSDFQVTAASRETHSIITMDESNDPVAVTAIGELAQKAEGSWGPLVYVPTLDNTVLNFRQPVIRDGSFLGAIIATIAVSSVNARMATAPVLADGKRFILYGLDRVLTQQGETEKPTTLSTENVVPKLEDIDDPVLKNIWSGDIRKFDILSKQDKFNSLHLDQGGKQYIFIYRHLDGYADRPFTVGYWILNDDISAEFKRLFLAGIAGLAIMLLSAFFAIMMGRRISKPILALSEASRQISKLDFSHVKPLSRSRFKEVNEANAAYNRMLRGLTWFETYVPKSLVHKLMESGEARSEQRVVTVMFTDIVGFTPQAEHMASDDVANFLNHHFRLVTSCIEKEGGTVDKFIGDAVMAFWGAPEIQEDHAARACRAALAIKQAILADNREKQAAGLPNLHMRIGIHTGPLVVGNIGSPGRLNYTVVGDTVNIAQRMEQYGKNLGDDPSDEVVILMTDATHHANPDVAAQKIGDYRLKGRVDPVTIFRLG
jgi:class 3 adenylate cyclase